MNLNRLTVPVLLAQAFALSGATAQEPEATADEASRRYAVEVIVFRYAEDVFGGNEIFIPEPTPDTADSIPADEPDIAGVVPIDSMRLVPPAPAAGDDGETGAEAAEDTGEEVAAEPVPASGALLLLDDELTMGDALARLERLDAYEPLMHFGWTQPGLAEADAVALELDFFGTPPAGLEGSLTLYLGRFLHLVVDLALDANASLEADPAVVAGEPAAEFSFGDARTQNLADDPLMVPNDRVLYRIQEDRILRNGEWRYFDHPKFGVIAWLSRLESAAEREPPDTLLPGVSR